MARIIYEARDERYTSKRRDFLIQLLIYLRQSDGSDYLQFVKACDVHFASKKWEFLIARIIYIVTMLVMKDLLQKGGTFLLCFT